MITSRYHSLVAVDSIRAVLLSLEDVNQRINLLNCVYNTPIIGKINKNIDWTKL